MTTEQPQPHVLTLSTEELRLLWMGTEVLAEANPEDEAALALDRKVSSLIREAGLR